MFNTFGGPRPKFQALVANFLPTLVADPVAALLELAFRPAHLSQEIGNVLRTEGIIKRLNGLNRAVTDPLTEADRPVQVDGFGQLGELIDEIGLALGQLRPHLLLIHTLSESY